MTSDEWSPWVWGGIRHLLFVRRNILADAAKNYLELSFNWYIFENK